MLLGVAGLFSNREIAMTLLAFVIMLINKIVPTKKNIFSLSYIEKGAQHPKSGQNIQCICLMFYTQCCLMVGLHC